MEPSLTELIPYQRRYDVPAFTNVSDYALDLANGEAASNKAGRSGEDARVFLIEAAERFLADHPGGFSATSARFPRDDSAVKLAEGVQLSSSTHHDHSS